MAIVRHMERTELQGGASHSEVEATYSIIRDGRAVYLQVDTYGSAERKLTGKKSQSIQFSSEAITQLRQILVHM
jgi:hypothetical protein